MKKIENKVYYFVVEHDKDCKPDVQTAAHKISDADVAVRRGRLACRVPLFTSYEGAEKVCKDNRFGRTRAKVFIADFTRGNLVVRKIEQSDNKRRGIFDRVDEYSFEKNSIEMQFNTRDDANIFKVWSSYDELLYYLD